MADRGVDKFYKIWYGFAAGCLLAGSGFLEVMPAAQAQPAISLSASDSVTVAQQVRSSGSDRSNQVWQQVYEQLPDLPKENDYVSQRTGEVVSSSTLVGRLIRYHRYVKQRPVQYRLDWKLTIADYLQANETMFATNYPGNSTFENNPLESDREAIASLSREQRNALVNTLVTLFYPKYEELVRQQAQREAASAANSEASEPQETPSPSPLPQRGNADLLK
jgi:hypothetical protein